jgi:hypothetical protein
MAPALEPMVGRYVRLAIDGVPHRVYFEEAGQGICSFVRDDRP